MFARRLTPLIAAGTFLLAGCGDEKPEAEVRSVVERYASASAGSDYQEICDELVAPALVRKVEQIGLPCELAFKRGLSAVTKPTLDVRAVRVIGSTAYAQVHSAAVNQAPSDDTIKLVKSGGGWRIAALQSAPPPAVAAPAPAPATKPAPSAIPPGAIPTG